MSELIHFVKSNHILLSSVEDSMNETVTNSPTPLTSEVSEASRVVRAPVELIFLSNQPISCLSMALKLRYRSLLVKRSPAILSVKFCGVQISVIVC